MNKWIDIPNPHPHSVMSYIMKNDMIHDTTCLLRGVFFKPSKEVRGGRKKKKKKKPPKRGKKRGKGEKGEMMFLFFSIPDLFLQYEHDLTSFEIFLPIDEWLDISLPEW